MRRQVASIVRGSVLRSKVLSLAKTCSIHPVVVIISFVCGAILFGVVGLLIAVLVAVCIKITLEHYYAEPVAPTD